MATAYLTKAKQVEYPTSDGKPMAETDFHFILMAGLRQTLDFHFVDDPMIYVSGNLLLFYEEGNKRRHVAPDVFVVKGVPKRMRLHFLLWEEGKSPNTIIEVTSKTTKKEDTNKKFVLYRDVLKVREYYLFDPFGDYLKPDRLRGYRLHNDEYVPIALVDGRMPSEELGLHLETDGGKLRLYNPETKAWLLTPDERAEQEAQRAEQEAQRAEQEAQRADEAERERAALLEENHRLRQQLDARRNGQ